jgi:hypothetical protein
MTCGQAATSARPDRCKRPRGGLTDARVPECTAEEAAT